MQALYLVVVHAEEGSVDSGHGFNETLVGGGQLELAEEASSHAAGGGTAETDLETNNSRVRFKSRHLSHHMRK